MHKATSGLLIVSVLMVLLPGCSRGNRPEGKWSVESGPYEAGVFSFEGDRFELRLKSGQRAVGSFEHIGSNRFQIVAEFTEDTDAICIARLPGVPWYGMKAIGELESGTPEALIGPVLDFSSTDLESGEIKVAVLQWYRKEDGEEYLKHTGEMVLKKIPA